MTRRTFRKCTKHAGAVQPSGNRSANAGLWKGSKSVVCGRARSKLPVVRQILFLRVRPYVQMLVETLLHEQT